MLDLLLQFMPPIESWLYLPILFGISVGYQSSSQGSQQASSQGLGPGYRGIPDQFLFSKPTADYTGGFLGDLQQRTLDRFTGGPFQFPTLNSQGLFQEQQNLFDYGLSKAVEQGINQFSGQFAQRGFLRPEATSSIVGSAAQNVAPQFAQLFAPAAQQNLMARTTLPEEIEQSRLKQYMDFGNMLTALVNGTSTSTGSSFGRSSGVNASAFNNAGGAQQMKALGVG